MQIVLSLKSEKPVLLPIAYRHLIHGAIYNALLKTNRELHDGGYEYKGRHFKFFTFGQLEGSYRLIEKTIEFSENIRLEIRSPDTKIVQALLNEFSQGKDIRLGKNILTITKCSLFEERFYTSEVKIRTVSPIVSYITMQDGHTLFFSPEEKEFYSLLVKNAKRKFLSQHPKAEKNFHLKITPCSGDFKKQVTHFKTTIITGYYGDFQLKASPEIINFLYDTGLGVKNSQGFGMFNILTEDDK